MQTKSIYKYGVGIKGDWRLIAKFKTIEEAKNYISWNKHRLANMEIREIIQ